MYWNNNKYDIFKPSEFGFILLYYLIFIFNFSGSWISWYFLFQ